MKQVSRIRDVVIALSLVIPSMVADAAPNPASQDWVAKYSNLSPEDWEAVCDSSKTGSESGCYGNYPSKALLKIFRLSENVSYGLPPVATMNSVYIQGFNGLSAVKTGTLSPRVTNNSGTDVFCYWLSLDGKNLSFSKLKGVNHDSFLAVSSTIVKNGDSNIPLYDCWSPAGLACADARVFYSPYYVLCVGDKPLGQIIVR